MYILQLLIPIVYYVHDDESWLTIDEVIAAIKRLTFWCTLYVYVIWALCIADTYTSNWNGKNAAYYRLSMVCPVWNKWNYSEESNRKKKSEGRCWVYSLELDAIFPYKYLEINRIKYAAPVSCAWNQILLKASVIIGLRTDHILLLILLLLFFFLLFFLLGRPSSKEA